MVASLRRGSDRVIAGVCSGLATYYHTDTRAIRVLWAVLTVCTAIIPGVLAYAACWLLIKPRSP